MYLLKFSHRVKKSCKLNKNITSEVLHNGKKEQLSDTHTHTHTPELFLWNLTLGYN